MINTFTNQSWIHLLLDIKKIENIKQNKDMDYDYVNDLFMPRSIKEKNFFISFVWQ